MTQTKKIKESLDKVLLNNDTEIISPDWLTEMIGYLDSVTEQGEDYYLAGYIGNNATSSKLLKTDANSSAKSCLRLNKCG